MTRLVDGLRARLAGTVHRLRGVRGHLDGFIDNALVGWVVAMDGSGPLRVGVFTGRGMIAEATANLYRGDVRAAGIGSGQNGFAVPLDAIALGTIAAGGGGIVIRTLGQKSHLIGRHVFGDGDIRQVPPQVAPPETRQEALEQLLYGAVTQLTGLLEQGIDLRGAPVPPLAAQEAIFGDADPVTGGRLPPLMTGYADYVRYRYRLDQTFDTDLDRAEISHFLNWYLAGYSTLRGGLRVPLSKNQIAWLNELVVIPGRRQALSRATWSFMLDVPPLLQNMDFNNPDWIDWVSYWWAINQARALNVEDCLVPPAYVRRLAGVPSDRAGQSLAPSRFMLRLRAETPLLKDLDLDDENDRRLLVLALVALSVQRPDYLRYIPQTSLNAVLDPDAGAPRPDSPAPFTRFIAGLAPDAPPVDRDALARALRLRGFDLDTCNFVTLTAAGNRLEAAMLPVPNAAAAPVDVQMIGPFEKASGLGQATRLSAAVLENTGLSLNCVDFDLDNPAPEGFSRVGALSEYRPARINLLHMNGESVPLAFAYQPDVFSGAYNIGYFFWELDTPAACHYLALGMLDEIWVSTDYGVQIYQPHTTKPVINVGMCFEDLPPIDRAGARRFVRRRFGFADSDFVFLVAFDSFSFVQRKNPVGTLLAFRRAFAGVAGVRLVIKTQNRGRVGDPVQKKIWEQVDTLIREDGRIAVLDETLSYDDLLKLKSGCDTYVSLHKSEGWGFGMIEAMNLGVPVVCTGYSGNMAFCNDDTAWLVAYDEVPLAPDDYIFVRKGQKWAEPDIADAARQLRAVHDDPVMRARRVEAAHAHVQRNFSAPAIAKRYKARLTKILKGL